jgi:hypothetical protein
MTNEPYAGHQHRLPGELGGVWHCYDPLCFEAPEEVYQAARMEELRERMRRTPLHVPNRVAARLFDPEPPELGPLGLPKR